MSNRQVWSAQFTEYVSIFSTDKECMTDIIYWYMNGKRKKLYIVYLPQYVIYVYQQHLDTTFW